MSFHFDHWELEDSRRKKVSKTTFAKTCSIILIPSKEEYVEEGIELWYSDTDQARAQMHLVRELQELIKCNPGLTMELAIAYLCQPQIKYSSALSKLLWNMQRNLDILLVDKHQVNYERNKDALSDVFDHFSQWSPTFTHYNSGEQALKAMGQGQARRSSCLRAVLLDYSIYQDESDHCFLQVISVLRTIYGMALLIGLCLPSPNESLKASALAVGADFVWTHPHSLASCARMLPVLLAAHMQEQEQTKIDFSSHLC